MATFQISSVQLAQAVSTLLASVAWSMVALVSGPLARAADLPPEQVGLVSHVKVVSDKVADVSSVEAWKQSYIKDGMSDKDKALAIFNTMVAYQTADGPPHEFIQHEGDLLDPLKMMNVYGYGYCSVSSANTAALARAVELKAQNATIDNHVVPEMWYDNAWHMMDADLIEYFPKADGTIASLQEIVDGVSKWQAGHPDFPVGPSHHQDRYKYMKNPGWKGGPEVLVHCPFYNDQGWLPDGDFAWGDTMACFDKFKFNYESGYSLGYQVNIELRPGEKLTRNWSNKGLWANMDSGKPPGSLKGVVGKGELRYTPKWGDLSPGRIGNGTLEYNVPLGDPLFLKGVVAADNLATQSQDKQAPLLHVADAAKPATLEIRMPSSYVYLTGAVDLNAVVGQGGDIKVLFSNNNGEDWKDLSTISASGDQKLDLNKLVLRQYDYRLKFVMNGKGTGLDSLKISHDVEQSQRALPALAEGANTIHFSAGPNLSTITYEASTTPAESKGKALSYEDLHAKVDNTGGSDGLIHSGGEPTTVDFPVATPQDMKHLRIFGFWRTDNPNNTVWNIEVSFDQGKTFKPVTNLTSCDQRFDQSLATVNDIPPGTRSATVRYVGTGPGSTVLWNFRIDADYAEADSGFRPVKVTYVWNEDGKDQTDVHVAAKPNESYTINCKSKPTMKSVIMELAD